MNGSISAMPPLRINLYSVASIIDDFCERVNPFVLTHSILYDSILSQIAKMASMNTKRPYYPF